MRLGLESRHGKIAQVGSKLNHRYLNKQEEEGYLVHTEKEKGCEDWGRDWSAVDTKEHQQKLEEARKD